MKGCAFKDGLLGLFERLERNLQDVEEQRDVVVLFT